MPENETAQKNLHTRRSNLPVLLFLAILLAISAALYFDFDWNMDGEPERVTINYTEAMDHRLPEPGRLPLVTTLPDLYTGSPVSGVALVGEEVGRQSLWLTDDTGKQKVLTLLDEDELPADLHPGQRVRVDGHAYLTRGLNETNMPDLSYTTRSALSEVDVFVYAQEFAPVR